MTGCSGGGKDSESASPARQSPSSSALSKASSDVPKQAVAVVGGVGAVTRELRLQTTYQPGFMPAGQRATIATAP